MAMATEKLALADNEKPIMLLFFYGQRDLRGIFSGISN